MQLHRLRAVCTGVVFASAAALSACGGGGGSTTPATTPPTATSTPAPTSASSQVTVTSAATSAPIPSYGGYSGTLTLPQSNVSGSATLTLTTSSTLPAGLTALQSIVLASADGATPLLYETLTSSTAITFNATPAFSITLPSSVSTSAVGFYIAAYDSTLGSWTQPSLGLASVSGQTLTFASQPATLSLYANVAYTFALYSILSPPAGVALSPASLSFTATGNSYAQAIKIAQPAYTGAFTVSPGTCSSIVTVGSPAGNAVLVTPVSAGTCSFTVSGGYGQSATLPVTVTTTTVTGQ